MRILAPVPLEGVERVNRIDLQGYREGPLENCRWKGCRRGGINAAKPLEATSAADSVDSLVCR